MKTLGKTSCVAKTRRYSKAVCTKVDGDALRAGGWRFCARWNRSKMRRKCEEAPPAKGKIEKKNEPRRTGTRWFRLWGVSLLKRIFLWRACSCLKLSCPHTLKISPRWRILSVRGVPMRLWERGAVGLEITKFVSECNVRPKFVLILYFADSPIL